MRNFCFLVGRSGSTSEGRVLYLQALIQSTVSVTKILPSLCQRTGLSAKLAVLDSMSDKHGDNQSNLGPSGTTLSLELTGFDSKRLDQC